MNILLEFFEYFVKHFLFLKKKTLEFKRETKLSLVTIIPPHTHTHSNYLNEEVDHVCIIALHRMHEGTLTTFDILITKKAP